MSFSSGDLSFLMNPIGVGATAYTKTMSGGSSYFNNECFDKKDNAQQVA